MKRWFSLLLALLMTCASVTGTAVSALAEDLLNETADFADAPILMDDELISDFESDEAPADFDLPSDFDMDLDALASEELAIDLGDWEEAEDSIPEETEAARAETLSIPYSQTIAEAAVYADLDAAEPFATLASGAVVLALDAVDDRVQAAFAASRGVVEGWIAAEALIALDDEAVVAYMDEAAISGAAALYADDVNRPLMAVECRFEGEAEEETEAEAAVEEAVEETEEPETAEEDAEEAEFDEAEAAEETEEAEAEAVDEAEVELTDNASVDADDVALNAQKLVMGEGERYERLEVTPISPNAQIYFSSSNSKVASVDANGVVTGVAKGNAVITARTTAGDKASCKVTVEKAPASVALSANAMTVGEGDDGQYSLSASVPEGSHVGTLVWTSSDEQVATIDEATGAITAHSAGEATITVETYNGKKAKCALTVNGAPARVTAEMESDTLYVGQKLEISHSALDVNGGDVTETGRATFVSSDTSVVTVTKAGVVKAKAVGEATITVTAYNGESASIDVNVAPAVTSVALAMKTKPTSGYLGVGQTLSAWSLTLKPNGAYPHKVTFKSSNSSIVKVMNASTGKIKAMKVGSAYITATTSNGKSARCKVTVRKAPTSVSLTPQSGKLQVGKSGTYKVGLNGAGGSYTFTSSNPKVASISSAGKVKALKAGTTTITVKTYNGKKKTAKLTVYTKTYAGMPSDLVSNTSSYHAGMSKAEKLEYVIYIAQNKLGCKYVWGSFGPNKFDCSGFAYYCFSKIGVKLKDSAYRQGYDTRYRKITKISSLRRGDIVCFDTVKDSDLSDHIGIYLGRGYFIHASSAAGKVVISQFKSSTSNYYQRNFSWGRRILE